MSLCNAVSGAPRLALSVALLGAIAGLTLLPASADAATTAPSSAATAIATAQLNNFTSSDWLLGTWRKSAGFSIPASAANKAAFTKGAQVRLANGQIRTILAVYQSGAHMSAMLSGAILDAATTGYPRSVSALSSTAAQPAPNTSASTGTSGATHSSVINNYTNTDWLNGVWRKSAGFSIPASSANSAAFKPGASVKLADGQVRSITAVYSSGSNMSVMLSGSSLSGSLGYPNKLYAASSTSTPTSGGSTSTPPSTSPSTPTTPSSGSTPTSPSSGTGTSTPGTSTSGTSGSGTVAPSTSLTVALNSFNGGDFSFGIYVRSPGISVKDTDANRAAFHKGAKVRFADGQIRTVTLYYRFGGNMTVLLDGSALNGSKVGFPRTVSVSSTGFNQTTPAGNTSQGGTAAPANPINLVGINLAGAEFSSGSLPGVYLKHYTYPGEADFKRYAGLNLKLVRLPFRWERLQPKLNQPLNATELGRLKATLDLANKHGMQVILDMHNYYRYYGKLIASSEVPIAAFADSWKRIATQVLNHPAVYGYGLMNEPHSTNGKWPAAALAAAKAIRTVDAKRWIFVAGDRWSSAYHWPSYNIQLISDAWMRNPANNLVYEAHLYLDSDYSGTYANAKAVYDPMEGVKRAKPFVEWLNKYKLRGFIGEHGVPDFSPSAVVAMDNLLKYLGQQCIPSTYWAAGPWWGEYALSLDVKSGKARPQLPVLQKHTANKSCGTIGLY